MLQLDILHWFKKLTWFNPNQGSMDGDHDINTCYKVTTNVLNECYNELELHKVDLKGTVLKPNMILDQSVKNQIKKIANDT